MKKTNVSTLKAKLSQYLKYVKQGERVQIFDRESFVAELVPAYGSRQSPMGRREQHRAYLEELERKGIVRLPDPSAAKAAVEHLKRHPLKFTGTSSGVLEALLAEREENV